MIAEPLRVELQALPRGVFSGVLTSVAGGLLEVEGLAGIAGIGRACRIPRVGRPAVLGEVIGLRGGTTLVLTEASPEDVRAGDRVELQPLQPVRPSDLWLGKVLDAFGRIRSAHGSSEPPPGNRVMPLRGTPPIGALRRKIGGRMNTGCNALNTFLPLCRGQRMGLFAGSGVGKSTLLATLARNADADVVVIGLIGERGREVNEFVTEALGPDGMQRAVVIAATADMSPLLKRRAALLTLATAEYFRDQGRHVLLLFDSVTRFAEAQREIGLAAGEPPAMRAFPPSVFSELAALVERAGPGESDGSQREIPQGDITAVFTVLVQGSDFEEPVADAVRGSLDGHCVLDRDIAERGRYPAINILRSISRSLPGCATPEENATLIACRKLMATYTDMAPMIRLGAYKAGSDAETDAALAAHDPLERFLSDTPNALDISAGFATLRAIADGRSPNATKISDVA